MNIEYLYNIINLYLSNEKGSHRTKMHIEKQEDNIRFSFNMDENDLDKTIVNLSVDEVKGEISNILNYYKQDIMIINEEYKNNKTNPYYHILLQNGRALSFDGFTILEINNMRNILYNININSEEIRLDALNEQKELAYKPAFTIQQAGFASYTTLFLVALYLTDAFLIALWIFKVITE